MTPDQMHLFERGDEMNIIERKLPHWQQAGAISFITWRTHDSMPEHVVKGWNAERIEWLVSHGLTDGQAIESNASQHLPNALKREFMRLFQNRWMAHLDECHGECVLRDPQLSSIVSSSLRHFDGQRYLLTDFVVMPNHVHLLAAFPNNDSMLTQCENWKRFTATQINRVLGREGRFWQVDDFDHLVRSEVQFQYLRDYIRNNPRQANLQPGEYVHYARQDL